MNQSDSERNPLDVLAEEFAQRCRRGEEPSINEYVEKYPELADEIRSLLPPVAMMENLKKRKKETRVQTKSERPPRLGEYEVLREIGRGGMGIVFEARHLSLGQHVAIKMLPRHMSQDTMRLQRFQREAEAAGRLHQTNIVSVFGVGETEGNHYFVMQYIRGRGLDKVLDELRSAPQIGIEETSISSQFGKPPEERYWRWVARLGVQVADALQYAHSHKVLHRDIKPGNLLLDSHGTVFVADFGLAKMADSTLTETGDVVGTPQYMAPECLESQADERSDICSLGLTLYELLTLRPPYAGCTAATLLGQISKRDPEAPGEIDPRIPCDLQTIVMKAIARSPKHRYQSAEEFGNDLRRYLEDRPILARPISLPEQLLRWCQRHRAVAALSGIAAASLTAALAAGWIGYVQTTGALARESKRREEADAATQKAEDNMRMSLRALEEMFDQIDTSGDAVPLMPPGPGEEMGPPGGGPPRRGSRGRRGPPQMGGGETQNAALLQSILKFYEQFAKQNSTDRKMQAEAARAHRRVGDLHGRLGDMPKAEAAYTQALQIATQLHAEIPGDAEVAAILGEAHGHMAVLLGKKREESSALENFNMAIAIFETLVKEHGAVQSYVLNLSAARFTKGDFLWRQEDLEQATPLIEQAITETERCLKAKPDRAVEHMLAMQYQRLSEVFLSDGKMKEAENAHRKARELGLMPPPGDDPDRR